MGLRDGESLWDLLSWTKLLQMHPTASEPNSEFLTVTATRQFMAQTPPKALKENLISSLVTIRH